MPVPFVTNPINGFSQASFAGNAAGTVSENPAYGNGPSLTGPETDVFQRTGQPQSNTNSADSGYAGKGMHPVTAQTWQEIERVSTPDLFHKATIFFNALQSFCRDNNPVRT